jgi:hypothetical protein
MRRLFAVAVIALLLWWVASGRDVQHPPGVLVREEPVQTDVPIGQRPFEKNGYTVTPLAHFDIRARVLGAEHYYLGRETELSPVDLALGWGPMSDTAVIDQLSISQGGRFYFYRWSNAPPIPQGEIVTHSANMHLIPAESAIARQLSWVRRGQLVHLVGWLVRAEARDGWHWVSSLTRADSGGGSCEVVWVESVEAM